MLVGRRGVADGPQQAKALPPDGDRSELIERIRRRDLRAFDRLYRDYRPRLTRFLTKLTGRPQLVEEVVNDTMLVVWNRPERFDGSCKLSTWIFAIAYRKALEALRHEEEAADEEPAATGASPEAGPEDELGQRQVRKILLAAIGELSPDHRTAVGLTYFREIGYREIADIMDCPVDTVKTRVFHARRHLRRRLAGRLADWL
jgi:RNA polymerase sigma-70 factor (ECF subfamily)